MNTEEHLKRIKEKCRELLALAKNRTPEEWYAGQYGMAVYSRHNRSAVITHTNAPDGNAAFIASCAGPAEAGWGDTLAAIDAINSYRKVKFAWDGDCGADEIIAALEASVLARWPEELL